MPLDYRAACYRFYWRARRLIAPRLSDSQQDYEQALEGRVDASTQWLDMGCGHRILPDWRADQEKCLAASCRMIVGIDYDVPSLLAHETISLRVRGSITELPFKDETFSLVSANMVVEHLDQPDVQLREVLRVLKPGGVFVFHTPCAMGYATMMSRLVPEFLKTRLISLLQGRRKADVFPAYYRANTRGRIHRLAESVGFEAVSVETVASSAQFVVVPPLMLLELAWIRLTMTKFLAPLRADIIAVLQKPGPSALPRDFETQ